MNKAQGTVQPIFNNEVIALSANALYPASGSPGIDIERAEGFFSLQVTVAGDGTAKFEYLLSNDGVDYFEPSSASDIASGQLKTSGPGSDGKDLFSFSPEPAKYLKIKATETAGANSITVTAHLFWS